MRGRRRSGGNGAQKCIDGVEIPIRHVLEVRPWHYGQVVISHRVVTGTHDNVKLPQRQSVGFTRGRIRSDIVGRDRGRRRPEIHATGQVTYVIELPVSGNTKGRTKRIVSGLVGRARVAVAAAGLRVDDIAP